jgi:DNA-binding IclR family transcriptional regulator
VILANLTPTLVARLYQQHAEAFRAAGIGGALNDVRAYLSEIRERGWDVTVAQVSPGVTGIATPIFDARENLLGSLSLAIQRVGMQPAEIAIIAERMRFCSRAITRVLAARSGQRLVKVRPGRSLERINATILE